MRFGINTLDDFDYKNKTVLCRLDLNQPVDREKGTLRSVVRIEAAIPTIKELSNAGAKLVLLTHQGSDIEYQNFYTTEPHAKVISNLIGKQVEFIPDVCGPFALEKIKVLNAGDILLLDNIRFLSEEQTLFELKLDLTIEQQTDTLLIRRLAPLADLYVCDAFAAAHRNQPSLCAFEQLLPSAMGRLFEKEYCVISELLESAKRPCTFVLGGAKIADAFLMMESILEKKAADYILAGGLVANILLIARGDSIGEGSLAFITKSNYAHFIDKAREIYKKYADVFVLPKDIAFVKDGKREEALLGSVPDTIAATDIGSKTAAEYARIICESKTVFVNGPMGVFEQAETELGTKTIWDALGNTNAYTVVGGGDSITATTKYGKTESISYICTGGGALVRFLTGEELPVIKALRDGAKKYHV